MGVVIQIQCNKVLLIVIIYTLSSQNSSIINNSLSFFISSRPNYSLSMDGQTLTPSLSPNQGQMNTLDLKFSNKNQNSRLNMSNPIHNSIFDNPKPLIGLLLNQFDSQVKEQQKILFSAPNPQNYVSSFINKNMSAPLNIHLNSFQDDIDVKAVKNQPESDDQQNEKPSKNIQQEFQSDKLQKYFDFMKQNFKNSNVYKIQSLPKQKIQKQFSPLVQRLQKKLEQNSIIKLKYQKVFTSVQLKNIAQYGSYQIVDLDVCLGKYQKNVKIYHSIQDSCFHSVESFNQGSFGSIYLGNFMGTQFIVKCVSKTNKNNYEHFHNFKQKPAFLKEILKEYMIANIAGILEIGPKVLNPFGFDLIVSKKCIEFFMQKCSPPQNYIEEIHDKFQQIKNSLFQLHLLNFVHNDVKPQNIMYNKKTGKLLFIDFGLSEYSKKQIGHKKETKFIGTYQYASPEMQKLLFENQSGMIDFFYNDAYGLNLALNKLFQIQKMQEKITKESLCGGTSKQTQNFLNIIFLKFLIWKQKVDQAITLSNIMGLKNQFELQKSILEFIQKIKHSSRLKYLYHESFHESIKQNPKFQRLKQSYARNISFGEIDLLQKNQDYKDFRDLYQHLQNMQHQITEKQTSFKQRSVTKLQKKQLLLGKGQKISNQQIWFLFVDFVNFLKRNEACSIQEKQEVSKFLMKSFEIKCDLVREGMMQETPALAPIAQCLYFLFKESLTSGSKNYELSRVPKLLSMLVLLGWNIPQEYIIEWQQILSLRCENIHQKIVSYLDFQIIKQISLNRSFKFQNERCLNFIDSLIRSLKKQKQGHEVQIKSFYDNLIYERKRQNINLQIQQLLNIVISLLQLNLNSKNITEQKLDQLVNDIEQLPHNLFQNKNKYLWTKSQLLFWVDLNYSFIRISQEKQLKLLEKIKSLQYLSYHHWEILIYHFQIISLYHNLKSFHQLKIQLENIDQTIDYSPISQNLCIPRRLLLSFMLKDLDQFAKIIRKIQKLTIRDFTDINLLRHTAYMYQNIHHYSAGINQYDEYIELFTHKIQNKMKELITNFDNEGSLKLQKTNRLCFVQFLRAIFAIGFLNIDKNQDSDKIFSVNNLKYMLQVLENLSYQFSDNQIITTFITQKMGFLLMQKKYSEACQFLEQQSHIKIQDLKLSNYRQVSILINYYFYKINCSDDEKAIYVKRLKEIYDEMIAKKYYNSIFNNRRIFCVILNSLQNHGQTFEFFKAMAEHLSHHPSKQNLEVLLWYLNDFVVAIINKFKDSSEQPKRKKLTIQSLEFTNQTGNESIDFLRTFYQYLKSQVNFKRLWQNPYMVLVIYVISSYCQLQAREAMKVYKIICRNIDYMNSDAKKFILKKYYQLIYTQKIKNSSKRKNVYLLKKHLKYTSQIYDFESILPLRTNKQNLLTSAYYQFPGQSHIRRKLYRYYDNLQILNKINFYDSLSTFSSERSLNDFIQQLS